MKGLISIGSRLSYHHPVCSYKRGVLGYRFAKCVVISDKTAKAKKIFLSDDRAIFFTF